MIFFRKPIMSKRWFFFLVENRLFFIFFFVLLGQGAFLGLSDDEAYYWVLAQKPSLGYAFHPPAVAWLIGLFQFLLGWAFGTHHPALVRLPAVFSMTVVLFLSLKWLYRVGLSPLKQNRAVIVLLSFCGFFPLSWMMVPDIPLFLGWTLLFVSTWSICNDEIGIHLSDRGKKNNLFNEYFVLGFGGALALLSKYSAILALFSSCICILIWANPKKRWKAIGTLGLSTVMASIPIVIWNANHQWASILYQIRDRHGDGSISWIRFARFWIVEMICAGPIALIYGAVLFWKALRQDHERRLVSFLSLWIVPPGVIFCLQPLFSDFKVHWAFVVWWPIFLGLAWSSQGSSWKWIRYQVYYGLTVGAVVLVLCHLPVGNWILYQLKGPGYDPKLDVTNDLYGWNGLEDYIRREFGQETLRLPVIGSRYQTAAQASFGIKNHSRVTFIPRDPKEWDEWPDFDVSEGRGPNWPKLKMSVLYVADIRYNSVPEFPDAQCQKLGRFEIKRFQLLAKWIDIWRCDPIARNF